jgi:hypothetical protein
VSQAHPTSERADDSSLSLEIYVERALAACVEQGFSVAIEDPTVLDFLADVLSRPWANATRVVPQDDPRSLADDRTRADENDRRGW